MKQIKILLIIISFLLTNTVSAQDKSAFSSMDVFELEWVTSPKISPNGKSVVYERRGMDIMTDSKSSRLWIINTDGSDHQKLTSVDANESGPNWSPDGSQIVFRQSTDHGSEIFVYWLSTGKIARLTQLSGSPGNIVWSPDGKQIAFTMFVPGDELSLVIPHKKPEGAKWADPPRVTSRLKHEADGSGYMQPGHTHIFVVPASGGTPRQITSGDFNNRSPIWSKDGQHLIFNSNRSDNWEYDFRNSELYRVNIKSRKIQALTTRNGPDHSHTLSSDGKSIAYVGYDDQVQTYQVSKLYLMDVDGSNSRILNTGLDRSVNNPTWAPDGESIYFQYDDKGNTKIGQITLSSKLTTIAHNLGGTSPGRPYGGGSFSIADNGLIAYTHTTPYHPSELALVSKSFSEKLIMNLNDDILEERSLGKVEEIWYKSSVDNRDIQGWIVYPPNFKSNNSYPLLVENHGGPISNYGDRFSPEMQLYATAGFVVFYPNPRGSTSYGEEFGNLLYHNYPGDDYHDVMDGVNELVKRPYLSEGNLFVTGGSAGGIMTSWIIGKNNRFKAAAVIKPVMNWISKTLVADNYYGYANSRFPGQPWENFETYWKFSPISLVGNIETPTLVMGGTLDMRTPLSEAKQLYHALKLRKIETALVEIPGAYHFISNKPSQLITKIEHIVAWFDRYR